MSTGDLIHRNAGALPDAFQKEALHYMDYLLSRQPQETEERDWSRFSLEQMSHHFVQRDAVYDQD